MNRADTIFSARVGVNADIFKDIVKLYVPNGSLVVDLTFGLGRFWTHTMLEDRTLIACDLEDRFPKTKPLFDNIQYMRLKAPDLPFKDGSVGTTIFDPPYGNNSKTPRKIGVAKEYNLASLACDMKTLLAHYQQVMNEIDRILITNGIAIIKCQDQIEWGKQFWIHCDLFFLATELGWIAEDLFVLSSKSPMIDPKIDEQRHARKNHSFFWVFRKRK